MHSSAQSALRHALQQATVCQHRTVLVLAGAQAWAVQQARLLVDGVANSVWMGESAAAPATAIPASKARQVLGSEYAVAVMDGWSGLHPDALAAVTGTVVAGGLLVLLTPPLPAWQHTPDPDYARLATYPHTWQTLPQRFVQRVAERLATSPGVLLLEQTGQNEGDQPDFTGFRWQWPTMPAPASTASPNPGQQALRDALLAHQQAAVVLAQRGRGKSALLGFVARALHASGKRVLLTAPSRAAAHSVFRHAGSDITFLAPDGILADDSVQADVLLVDEAAAISLPVLLGLLARFPRVIFASTTEGYEGTGQGFVLRFLRELDKHAPGWQHYTLAAPVRWAAGDPLEALAYRLFLLDAEPDHTINLAKPAISAVTQAQLAADEALLQQVYGLLRSAHYRTTPDDLRFLLDAPGVSLTVMTMGTAVIGVALLVREGELDDAMAQAIAARQRRPRGHLLVQTLAVQEAQPQYLQQRVARVVRIAIHPQLQGQGYGSQLLQHLMADQQQQGVHVLGSSFSATPEVLAFWQRNGFSLVRIGHRRQTASAAPSAVVVRVL